MSRGNLYIIAAIVLLLLVMAGVSAETKSTFISLTTIALWLGVGLFWLWVYLQSKSRKLFVSKVVVMLGTLSGFIITRHTLRLLDVGSTLVSDLISGIVAAMIAIETYDLWRQSGRDAGRIDKIEKKDHEK